MSDSQSTQPSDDNDPVVRAANDLARALRASVIEAMDALERLDAFRADRAAGVGYDDLVVAPVDRTVVAMLSHSQVQLATAGSVFRRAVARMMQEQGVSQADIARSFGVSRQRVAALLGSDPLGSDQSDLDI